MVLKLTGVEKMEDLRNFRLYLKFKNWMDMSCSTLAHSRAEAIRIVLKDGKLKDCVSVEVVGKGQKVGND